MSSQQVKAWVDQALYDAKSGVILFNAGQWSASCLAAQQAAEKILKGLCLYAGITVDFTHSLKKLQENIESALQKASATPSTSGAAERIFPAKLVRAAQVMTKTFQTSRYPGMDVDEAPFSLFSEEDGREHLAWLNDYIALAAREIALDVELQQKAVAAMESITEILKR